MKLQGQCQILIDQLLTIYSEFFSVLLGVELVQAGKESALRLRVASVTARFVAWVGLGPQNF